MTMGINQLHVRIRSADDCPNCGGESDDCPHLREHDKCPECGSSLVKPPAGKVRCLDCLYVVNGQYNDQEMADVPMTYNQTRRFLRAFGYDHQGTPGGIGTRFRRFCHEEDVDRHDLINVLDDLRRDRKRVPEPETWLERVQYVLGRWDDD